MCGVALTGLVRFIMGGNQLFDTKLRKVQLKVAEEITGITAQAITKMILPVLSNRRVIGVAENDFPLKY